MNERPRFPRRQAVDAAGLVAALLAEEPSVRLVYVYGSAVAEGGPETVRDVDVAVLVDPPPSPDGWRRLQSIASRASTVPVDLVLFDRASVVLAREIVDTGRCLWVDSPETQVEVVTRARSRYWDFQPYLEQQWELTRQRAEERVAHGSPD